MPEQASQQVNWKRVGIITAAVILIIIIITAIWWFFLRGPKEVPTTSTAPSAKTTKTSTPSATPSAKPATPSAKKDGTQGWKTYSTEIGKFSLKYPATFTLSENNPAAEKWSIVLKSNDYNILLGGACPFPNVTQGAYLEVAVESFSGAKNTLTEIADFYRKAPLVDKPAISTETSLKLDEQDAVKFTYTGPSDKYSCNYPSKSQTSEVVWTVNKNGVDYSFRIHYFNQGKENFGLLFDQILSTFRFD